MRLFALSLVALALSGCATVQSDHNTQVATARGFTYFLPERHVKLTATKETLDPPKIKAALDTKSKELEAAKAAAVAADQNSKAKAATLASLPATAAAATRQAATQESEIAQAELVVATANMEGLNATVNGLKKLLETAQVTPTGNCGYTAKLELLPAQGDGTARFLANPVHNALRDDSTKLTATPDGLLSSSNVIAADRTADIIVEIAGAIGGLARGPQSIFSEPGSEAAEDCTKSKKVVMIFDPARGADYVQVNADLSAAGYPLLITKAAGPDQPPMAPPPNTAANLPTDAIFYRTPLPVRIRIAECPDAPCNAGEAATVVEDVLVSLPQAGPISYIPQRSSAFVKTVNDVQFENGMIKSWSADRPSEVLEVVRLPVRILTALVSVPANLFQLRVNYDTQAKSLAEVQAAQIAASTRLQLLQACLDAAGEDAAAARGCLSK